MADNMVFAGYTLPPDVKEFIRNRAKKRDFKSASAFLTALIQREMLKNGIIPKGRRV